MPKGNQMPGTPIGSSSSPPKSAAIVEANVTSARIRMGPLRRMRAPVTTNSTIDARRLPLVTLAEGITAPMIPPTASTPADTSMLRHGGRRQRFQANVQAVIVGIHITDASHAYVVRSIRSVHATIALLRRLAAISARAMLAQ